METISGWLGVLLLLWPPARALFAYDSPAAGYVAAPGDHHQRMPAHKMYYISNANLRNMKLVNERAVDSYFRILRATPLTFSAAAARDRSSPPQRRATAGTEPPQPRQHTAESPAYAPHNEPRKDHHRDNDKTTPGLNQNTKAKDEELFNPSRNEYFRRHNVYEKRDMSQGDNRHNRRPHRAHNFHQKMYLSQQASDKILRKADVDGDRNGRPARLLVDKAVHNAKEYRKRNTIDREAISQRIDEQNVNQLNSAGYMRAAEDANRPLFCRTGAELEAPPLDARAALQEAGDGAYYRGGASSYVHLNTGRARALAKRQPTN